MRTWLLALLAAFAGVAAGVGITVAEFAPAEEIFVVSADSEAIDIDPTAGRRARRHFVYPDTHSLVFFKAVDRVRHKIGRRQYDRFRKRVRLRYHLDLVAVLSH